MTRTGAVRAGCPGPAASESRVPLTDPRVIFHFSSLGHGQRDPAGDVKFKIYCFACEELFVSNGETVDMAYFRDTSGSESSHWHGSNHGLI